MGAAADRDRGRRSWEGPAAAASGAGGPPPSLFTCSCRPCAVLHSVAHLVASGLRVVVTSSDRRRHGLSSSSGRVDYLTKARPRAHHPRLHARGSLAALRLAARGAMAATGARTPGASDRGERCCCLGRERLPKPWPSVRAPADDRKNIARVRIKYAEAGGRPPPRRRWSRGRCRTAVDPRTLTFPAPAAARPTVPGGRVRAPPRGTRSLAGEKRRERGASGPGAGGGGPWAPGQAPTVVRTDCGPRRANT